jgi:hypothetical protein
MRIFDVNNVEIKNPDLSRGYLREDRIFARHHEAVEPVEEQWHYEIVAEYPNGGKDIRKVIDVVGVKAQDAWDEYENIHRYIEYTEDELVKNDDLPTVNDRLDKIEEALLRFTQFMNSYQK